MYFFILIFINILLINLTFLLAFVFRFSFNIPEFNFSSYKDNFIFLTIIYILAFAYAELFKKRFPTYWDLFKRIFMGLFYGTLFGVVLLYIFRLKWASFPSSIFLISFPLGLLLIFLVNAAVIKITGRIKKKIIIIGKVRSIAEVLDDNEALIEKKHINNIEEILPDEDVDEIIICEHLHQDKQFNLLIALLLKLKVSVVFSPRIYAELMSGNFMEENAMPFLATFFGRKSDYEEFMIRAFDVFASIIMSVVFCPIFIWAAIVIKFTSRGPVFFKQERVSKDGGTFILYKFRTMVDNAEKHTGPVLASHNDPRITRIGRFFRRTRIDEIPQLINVLRGDMSLVGPRPERPHFVKLHKALREVRLAVKPGLTGLAQVRSFYDLHPKHKVKYDYLYIQRRSLLLNVYILLKTIPVIIMKKGR